MAELHYRSADEGWFSYHLRLLALQIIVAAGLQYALLVFGPASPADDPTVPDQVQMKGEILLIRDDLLQDLLGLLRPDLFAHQAQPVR